MPTRIVLTAALALFSALDSSAAAQSAPDNPAAEAELVLDTQGFTDMVGDLAISPDGKLLAAAGNKEVRIWSLESGDLVKTLRGQRERTSYGNCYTLAFSPDGRWLLVGIDDYSADGSVRVYDTGNLDEIHALLPGHNAPVKRLAFSRDGQYLASAGSNGKVLLWQWGTRRVLATVEPSQKDQPLYYYFGFPTAEPFLLVQESKGPSIIGVPAGKRLVPGDPIPDALRRWFGVRGGAKLPLGTGTSCMSVRLDQGKWLAAGSGTKDGSAEYWVAVWQKEALDPATVYRAHRYVVMAAAMNRDCDLAASADVFGEIHVWETATGRSRHVFRSLGKPVYRAALDATGRQIGFGLKPNPGDLWNRNSFGKVQHTFHFDRRRIDDFSAGPYQVESPTRGRFSLTVRQHDGNQYLALMDGANMVQEYRIRAGATPTCYTLLASPRLGLETPVALGDDSGGVLVYDPRNSEERRSLAGHDSFVTSLSESADGRLLVTSSTDRTIRVWSLENYRPTGDVPFKYINDAVYEVKPLSSAARAGIQVGDRYLAMDGLDKSELSRQKLKGTYYWRPGQRVTLSMERNGKPYEAQVTLKEGYDLAEPLLSLFIADDSQWVLWTPQGYYDASPGGDRLIGWHVNQGPAHAARFYPVHQFRKQLYRPDVIDQVLNTGSVEEAVRIANAAMAQPTQTVDLRQPETIQKMEPPQVRILEPANGAKTKTAEIAIRAEAESQNALPITNVTVLVNGRPPAAKNISRDRDESGLKHTIVRQVQLLPGDNEISLIASNSASDSRPASVRVRYEAPQAEEVILPNLYLLAIGVSEYADGKLNLQFAHKDAETFARAWEAQRGVLYRNIETKIVTNKEATLQNILSAMDWLVKSVSQRDVAVMFVSAHGVRDERQNYYLATHEVNPLNLRSTGVRFSEIKELLRDLPCKVLLFVDTCHSGGITGAKAAGWEDPLQDLVSEEYGAVVFSSSLPREVSLEDPAWGHGAFTRGLIDTFGDPASDANHDGYLSIIEMELSLDRRVKELTQGRQHPVVDRPPTVSNFSFYRWR
ncbi:MAG: caspase family protein [Pirellulales bacterium]|nr:caspase family protein [Pirellulales bacterium]